MRTARCQPELKLCLYAPLRELSISLSNLLCQLSSWRGGQRFFSPCSSTIRCFVPGGRTRKVFRNSMTDPCSYSESASKACRDASASPACASTARRSVVYCPGWKNGGPLPLPHRFRGRNLRLPVKHP